MGAYLSGPKTDKASTDEANDYLIVGASSMQGWRNSQEDAHNSILNFDETTSFFAVYDGHGGAEVAAYCAEKLPQFLKELATYKNGDLSKALQEAFLGFDKTLLEPEVIKVLKKLAGEKNFGEGEDSEAMDEDEDYEDLVELHEESNLPLNEVLEKYKEGSASASMPLKKVKDNSDDEDGPQLFCMRGRRAAAVIADAVNKRVMDPDAHPAGSSTSAAALASALSHCDAGPSSSKVALTKMRAGEPEDDSTVSSSSSSATKSIANKNTVASVATSASSAPSCESTEAEAVSSKTAPVTANGSTVNAIANSCISPDSSYVKESEQNGNVTSSEAKVASNIKADDAVCTSDVSSVKAAADDATVSGSNDTTESKQNGNVASSSSSPAMKSPNASVHRSAISSTSTEEKSPKKNALGDDDSTDDDADYDVESGDDGDCDEDVDEEDEDYDYEEEEEDEDALFVQERFCANMIEEPGKDSGCTAVVALLHGRDLYVANAGDSRCVICRNGKAIDMSLDHKPEDEEEASRIIKAGGRVTLDGRVNGGLNLSRALGDHAYKMNLELPAEEQMISALPDIKKLIISPEDEFMILACDGIWNYMSSEDVVEFVRVRLQKNPENISKICEELFDNCLAPNTMGDGTGCDNMTAVIVRFMPKLLDQPTKINPEETEDVLVAKQAAEADAADIKLQKALKRCASPTSEAEQVGAGMAASTGVVSNKTKRLKTDEEPTANTPSGEADITVDISDPVNATSAPTSTSQSYILDVNKAISTTIANNVAELKECDSVTPSTNEATATLTST